MRQTFWVGVYPGLTTTMLDYVAASLREALGSTG
jgi:dTDP-4-amino-4,6-dideoxygalactose transaminase